MLEFACRDRMHNVLLRRLRRDKLAHILPEAQDSDAIRHFEDIDRLARAAGFVLQADHDMPANNRLLLWHRP